MSGDERRKMSNWLDNDRIRKELRGSSFALLREFQNLFPPQKKDDDVYTNWFIEIITEEFLESGWDYFPLCLYWKEPYADFWKRWNRFKNLKVFL